jgi:hypothetical protein
LNIAEALRINSKTNTAKGKAPSAMTTAIFHNTESAISIG